ncbi:unnamed protein product, partial [Iphiclides podalirius]
MDRKSDPVLTPKAKAAAIRLPRSVARRFCSCVHFTAPFTTTDGTVRDLGSSNRDQRRQESFVDRLKLTPAVRRRGQRLQNGAAALVSQRRASLNRSTALIRARPSKHGGRQDTRAYRDSLAQLAGTLRAVIVVRQSARPNRPSSRLILTGDVNF